MRRVFQQTVLAKPEVFTGDVAGDGIGGADDGRGEVLGAVKGAGEMVCGRGDEKG
jgi:hypothetical protein